MALVLKAGIVVEDNWRFLDHPDANLANDFYVLPLAVWQQHRKDIITRGDSSGFWISSDEDVLEISDTLHDAQIIAIEFIYFADGRGFSSARLLRERLQFRGELRAFGHITRDQLYMLNRCGFDVYALPQEKDLQAARTALNDFSNAYQVAVDQPVPLFRRRQFD